MKPTKTIRVVRPEMMEPLKQPMGLGDAVAKVAQPIARAIDVVLGTNVHGCGGCAQRQAALNKAVPDILSPFKH